MKKSEKKAVKPQVQSELFILEKKDSKKTYVRYEYKCTKPILMRGGVQMLFVEYDND